MSTIKLSKSSTGAIIVESIGKAVTTFSMPAHAKASQNKQVEVYQGESLVVTFDYDDVEIDGNSGFVSQVEAILALSELFSKGGGDGSGSQSGGGNSTNDCYKPTFIISSYTPQDIPVNETTQITIKGWFLDYINAVTVTAPNDTGIAVNIVSQSFDTLVLELTTNSDVQQYDVQLSSPQQNETISITSEVFTLFIPKVIGTAPELWQKTGTSNAVVLADGELTMEQNNGNGWNEFAYFGSFTSTNKIKLSFICQGLQNSAYARIRMNTSNTASTGGQPRIDINNGSQATFYSQTGGSLGSVSDLQNGDLIEMVLEPTQLTYYRNGVQVGTQAGAVIMANIYAAFTGYRYFKAEDIQVKVY